MRGGVAGERGTALLSCRFCSIALTSQFFLHWSAVPLAQPWMLPLPLRVPGSCRGFSSLPRHPDGC